jgi:aquaporin Z
MKALLTETIGTFFLVLTIGLTANAAEPLAAIAVGLILMAMVYAGAHTSGAHYNPAMSLGLIVRGAFPASKLAGYWAAQFVGALVAGFLIWKFSGQPVHISPAELSTPLKAIVGEAIGTFGLAYVVMQVAARNGVPSNGHYGLAIGVAVTALMLAFAPLTGAAFNPAVGLAPALVEMVLGREVAPLFWVYGVGPFIGALAAGVVCKYQES